MQTTIKFVEKRDGRVLKFNAAKIMTAIRKAFEANGEFDKKELKRLTQLVLNKLEAENIETASVEHIQDTVEKVLGENGHIDVAIGYIRYRQERTFEREKNQKIHKIVKKIVKLTDRENANVGNSPASKLLQIAEAEGRDFMEKELTSPEVAAAMRENILYPHDYSWGPIGTTTCVPDFEYVLLRLQNGETLRTKFDYFNQLMDENKDSIFMVGEQEVLDLEKTKIRLQVYGRTGWTSLNKVMRRPMAKGEKIKKIVVKKGLPLHLTEKHLVPVLREENEMLLEVKDIVRGDRLFGIKTDYNEVEELDLIDMFVKARTELTDDIRITNANKLIQWLRFYDDSFRFTEKVNGRSNFTGINELSLEEYEIIERNYQIPYDVKKLLSLSVRGSKKHFPAFLPITNEFARLLGYIASEGSVDDVPGASSVIVCNQNPRILEDMRICIQRVFNDNPSMRRDSRSKEPNGFAMCGKLYTNFIKRVMGMKSHAAEIDIPEFLFSASNDIKANFLQALFDGDGYYSEKCIGYATVSEKLAGKLVLFLRGMGIECNFRKADVKGTEVVFNKRIYKRKYDNYIVTITDVENMKKFLDSVKSEKGNEKTKAYVNSTVPSGINRKNEVGDVIDVDYSRNVFDLETAEHWFSVNDYVVHNCCFIPLGKLLNEGFNNGHGWIRSPKRIRTATQLACIILQSNQNDQHGGQAFGWWDRDLAPFVSREYEWQVTRVMETLYDTGFIEKELPNIGEILGVDIEISENQDFLSLLEGVDEEKYKEFLKKFKEVFASLPTALQEKIAITAWKYTSLETFQSMEGAVFNLNTMHSRAGAQVPFTSINIGTDTTREGRLIAKSTLQAYKKGLGKGEQPIFPNVIFKVKKGVNAMPGDPNYDLFWLSMQTSCGRLFPNYGFQDSSINKDFPEDVPTMGCRTRVSWNVNSEKQTCEGRGNNSFSTNNIVGIALKSKYKLGFNDETAEKFNALVDTYGIEIPEAYKDLDLVKTFFVELNKYVELTIRQLLERYEYQCSFRKTDFPFLLSGVWMDSQKLKDSDTLKEVWKHGTLSMGFIGLAETLKCLVGKHHGEDEDADKLGEQIIKFMDTKMAEATKKHHLNFSLLATPAEGLAGKFTAKDREIYGLLEGITDKEWYTNSFHVPVEYGISVFKKIKVEGKYHKYCKAGCISYIELDAAPSDNIEAFYEILKYMMENDMIYVAINFPVDRCRECGYQGVIEGNCPVCESKNISRIRRITGYLAELDMFNAAKKQEALNRTKHFMQH